MRSPTKFLVGRAVGLAVIIAACGRDQGPVVSPTHSIVRVQVEAYGRTTPVNVVIGSTVVLRGRAFDETGQEAPAEFTWTSADARIVFVDPQGVVQAINLGQTWVRGSTTAYGVTFSDSIHVTVVGPLGG